MTSSDEPTDITAKLFTELAAANKRERDLELEVAKLKAELAEVYGWMDLPIQKFALNPEKPCRPSPER
jgi:hypothetical protein